MKKIVSMFLIIILLISGCGETSNDNTTNTSGVTDMEMIDFIEIEQAGIDWNEVEFPISSKEIAIPFNIKSIATKEDAIKIGKAIIENCWDNGKFLDFVLLTIVHSTEDNVWRFDYSIDQRNKKDGTLLLCGGFYVAIDGNNGKVIKAWVEE